MVTTRKSSILGPDAKPIEVALLSGESAGPMSMGARMIPHDQVASGLTPERLAATLRAATLGQSRAYLTLAMEMEERYLHFGSQMQTRRLAFDAIETSVEAPKGVPAKIVDAVTELVNNPLFREATSDLNDALAKGYSVVEPRWEYQGGYLQPVEYNHRDPRFFRYDDVSLSKLHLLDDTGGLGMQLAAPYFFVHEPRIRTGIPIRRGLARPAAWAFLIQSFTLQDWAAFAEVYGMPFRVGKYHPGASALDKRKLLQAVRDIANDAAAIIPEGMSIDFHEVSGNQGERVFGSLLDYVDRNVSKLVVGQTMTADDGSSLGQAKIHNEVRLDILRADCRQMGGTANSEMIQCFVAMNFGPQDQYPLVKFPVSEPEDIAALSSALKDTVPLGLRVSQRQIRSKFGLSEPEEDEDILSAPKPAAPEPPADVEPPAGRSGKKSERLAALPAGHVLGCRCRSCLSAELLAAGAGDADRDEVDDVQDEALSDWQEIADPLLEELFALAAEAGSYEEVLARLDGLRVNSGPLREKLARATAIARGLGDVKD